MKGETIRFDRRVDSVHWLACEQCGSETQHVVIRSAEVRGANAFGVEYEGRFQIIKCSGCEWISFRQCWIDLEQDPSGNGDEENEQLFPGRLEGRRLVAGFGRLPPKVRRAYRETYDAMVGNQPILAGVGVGILIEAVCDAKKARGKDLHTQLNSLVAMGIFTPADGKVLQGAKWLRNRSAHAAIAPTANQLGAAMDAAEHLLRTVFLVRHLARRLPRKNARRPPHKK